jgi:hypothetical protein
MKRRAACVAVLAAGLFLGGSRAEGGPAGFEGAIAKVYDLFLRPVFKKDFSQIKSEVLGALGSLGKAFGDFGGIAQELMGGDLSVKGLKQQSTRP